MATDDVGITKIPLTEQGDTIIVQRSGAAPLGVIITLHDSRGKGTSNVDASPPECDALIVAIGRALGRAALPHGWLLKQAEQWALNPDAMIPAAHVLAAVRAWLPQVATPLEERILRAWRKARNEADTHDHRESAARRDGAAHAYLDAARMVREQGATVPRAGVEALRFRLDAHPLLRLNIHSSTYARNASLELDSIRAQVDALLGVTEEEAREAKERTQRATLEAAGLWPLPPGER